MRFSKAAAANKGMPMLHRDKPSIVPNDGVLINPRSKCAAWKRYNAVFWASPPVMKLHANNTQQYQTVTGYDETGVEINAIHFAHSLVVMPEEAPQAWNVSAFAELTPAHFQEILERDPQVVILGTGATQRFIHPRLVADLTAKHIGVECMDSQAACRTYNILMAEGRKVALALVIENKAP
jgi:uncharacterized protein